ncbi:MAG: hypothetical protein N3G78_06835 [Desulfobacterota bacterium]|nr:hypothetical protein [Thermodesulfobacteriota bacterium]
MNREQRLQEEERLALYRILKGILEHWRAELKQQEEEFTETVVLSPGRGGRPAVASESETPIEGEVLTATVILPSQRGPITPPAVAEAEGRIAEPTEPQKGKHPETEECLEETVILKPKTPKGKGIG